MADLRWEEEGLAIHAYGEDGTMLAEATFEAPEAGTLDVNHTFVDESLRGTGMASELMRRVVEFAEARDVRLLASCPFAHGWLERHQDLTAEPGHPLNVLSLENAELERRLDRLDALLRTDAPSVAELTYALSVVSKAVAHYDKKDQLVLPALRRHGAEGPADEMWEADGDLRASMASLLGRLEGEAADVTPFGGDEGGEDPADSALASAEDVDAARDLSRRMRDVARQEGQALFPLAQKELSQGEWQAIWHDIPRFGLAWLEEVPAWVGAGAAPEATPRIVAADARDASDADGAAREGSPADVVVSLPTGELSLEQLDAILRTLPMELTFIDASDTSRFFSEESSLFPRPLSALGTNIFDCHPPKAQPVVRHVLDMLRSGERDSVSFTTTKHGRKAYVRYLALRSKDGTYLGTLEVAEDVTDIA